MQGERVWIIGASSGIGRELAIRLANGGATLLLSARKHEALQALAESLPGKHEVLPLDVTDGEAIEAALTKAFHPGSSLRRIIYLAAAYEPMRFGAMDLSQVAKIIDINIKAPFLFIESLLRHLGDSCNLQLALCASVAGYNGLPGGQPYSATKAALINLAESLRAEVGSKIDIRLINPGFVESPLTAKNGFSMPAIISAKVAAAEIEKGLRSKKFEIHFPKRFTLLMKVLRMVPYWCYFCLISQLTKGAEDESARS